MFDYTYSGNPIETCRGCGTKMKLKVLCSGGGHYIGRKCMCGPYSREHQDYFPTREQAETILAAMKKLYNITY